jgi:hypothetical protein
MNYGIADSRSDSRVFDFAADIREMRAHRASFYADGD